MQRESYFLKYKPSSVGAASLLFAFNLSKSNLAAEILGIKPIPEEKLNNRLAKSLAIHRNVTSEMDANFDDEIIEHPLSLWTSDIS